LSFIDVYPFIRFSQRTAVALYELAVRTLVNGTTPTTDFLEPFHTKESTNTMESRSHDRKTVIWIVGQHTMLNDLLMRSMQKKKKLRCKYAPSFNEIPWFQLNPISSWIALIDTQGMDQDAVGAIIQACDSRHNCCKALYNTQVADQLALEQMAFRYNWQGVFSIGVGLEKLLGGITDLIDGRLWLQREALPDHKVQYQSLGHSPSAGIEALTERERQVLCVIARGATNEEISICLNIGLHTVKKHIYHIYQKINVQNRLRAAIWGIENLRPL
jgi:LuxR family transcriptional regulator of csgAB operon